MFYQISDIFSSLDNTGDRLIEFEEFKVGFQCTYNMYSLNVYDQGVMENMKDSGWTKETKEAEQINEEEIRYYSRTVSVV